MTVPFPVDKTELIVPVNTVPARNNGKSQLAATENKAYSVLLSVKIHLVKASPDRSISTMKAVRLRYEHHEYALFSVAASCVFSVVPSRYCTGLCSMNMFKTCMVQ